MKTKRINVTIEFEDSPFIQSKLEAFIYESFGENVKHMRILPNVDKLKEESPHFRRLLKAKKDLNWEIGSYINKYNK